ncbi:hypothetical protein C7M61_004890 [Candidozyma pseudohaemuli]|uniref:Uncharacterized protein n=1 Tax=Candidozyma pseudohaemuli TaxID=418784 RepID=A0A2P7YFG5_9ASCO|nr:hypothetical protein C7M61_004890 [[Candida] pseudohaemulonii]PSK34698.1 hypothetical protein C7M61_004890 [[Candida] pseudohaemulonii]
MPNIASLISTTDGMSESTQNGSDIADIKAKLIKVSPSLLDFDSSFWLIQRDILTLLSQPSNEAPKRNLQAADALLIWYLRAVQALKAGADPTLVPLDDIFSDSVFNWVTGSLNFSHGAQANAGLGLLRRLVQLLLLLDRAKGDELCTKWAISVFHDLSLKKEHFQIIETLAKECPQVSQGFKENIPGFVEVLVSACASGAVANAAAKCLAALLQNLQTDFSEGEFVNYWATPVVSGLHNPKTSSNIIQHLLPILLRMTPNSVEILIKNHIDASQPELLLAVLNVSQKLSKSKDPIDSGILTEGEMFELMVSDTESIRLSALQLVVSTIKTSRIPSAHILKLLTDECILEGFVEDSRSSETRDAFSSTIRKAVISLKDCYIHNRESSPEAIKGVFQWLLSYFMKKLSPSSSYLLLLIAFDFFEVLVEEEFDGVARKNTQKLKNLIPVLEVFTLSFNSVMLRFTTNNYEDIRGKARKLLQTCPSGLLFDELDGLFSEYLNNAIEALKSVQGRKSDENVNLLLLLATHYSTNQRKLLEFIRLIQERLLQVNGESPHGFYTFFSKAFQTSPEFFLEQETYSTELFRCLLKCCQKLWQQYKANTTFETLEDSDGLEASSWRPVRESALLLDTMIALNKKSRFVFLDNELFLEACELTRDQLSNITHRGVFMAVFNTYVSACVVCLESPSLKDYPKIWLQESLDLIKAKTQFVSRRSGGLPFLITGAIIAHKKTGVDEIIDSTMKMLIEYTKIPLREEDRAKAGFPQVHAFNCIKHLFLESALFPSAKRYLNEALSLALESIDSPEWSIKNAALMLFTSLQNRIFGTNMVDNLLSGMKTSVFFSMYRDLEDKFYSRLSKFGENEGGSVESILSILTILERLEWSGTDESLFNSFYTLLQDRYLSHQRWKIREMTARVLYKMALTTNKEKAVEHCITGVFSSMSMNKIHGFLLLVSKLSREVRINDEDMRDVFHFVLKLNNWQVFSVWLDMLPEDPPLSLVEPLGDLFVQKLIEESKKPNRAKQSTLAKVVKILHHYHLKNDKAEVAEDLLLLALESDAYVIQELVIECCQKHEKLSHRLKETLEQLAQAPLTWSYTRVKVIELLVAAGSNQRIKTPDTKWSQELQVLDLAAQSVPDIWQLARYLHSYETDETNLLCVEVLERLMRPKEELDGDYIEDVIVLLLISCKSECRPARRRAADVLSRSFNLSSDWSTTYTFRKALEAYGDFGGREGSILRNSLTLYRTGFEEFTKKNQLDLDRDDLYMNEAMVHSELSRRTKMDVSEDVDKVMQIIQKSPLLKSWEYDYLFDVSLHKLMNLVSEADKERLLEALKSIDYCYH